MFLREQQIWHTPFIHITHTVSLDDCVVVVQITNNLDIGSILHEQSVLQLLKSTPTQIRVYMKYQDSHSHTVNSKSVSKCYLLQLSAPLHTLIIK